MIVCFPDTGTACTPLCRNCGRELVREENPPDTGRGRAYWDRACGCVIEPEQQKDFGFTDKDLSRFTALAAARGFDVDRDVGLHVLNSLAETGTKVVVGLPAADIVITAQQVEEAIGRTLDPYR